MRKKICIVTVALGGGGAERSVGLLSIMLKKMDYDVHIVTAVNDIVYPFSGTLLNLGLIKEKHSKITGSLIRFYRLYKYIRQQDFDYVIDSRTRMNRLQEIIISKLLYKPNRTIYCVRSFFISNYLPSQRFIAKWCYGKAHKIVCVSEDISKKIKNKYRFDNVVTINNPIQQDTSTDEHTNIPYDNYILFFGRLEDSVKNISLLLNAYEKSVLPTKNVKLVIMGDGKDKSMLKNKANAMQCHSYIEFLDYIPNPSPIIVKSKFTVLTSNHEGFPRMILESLALGTPVISVDCESGPREMINHRNNGLLVENHNPDALAAAMDDLYLNNSLYNTCKANAKASVAKFSLDNIAFKWHKILNEN